MSRFDVLISGVLMGFIAPQARQHLSADALFGVLRNTFAKVPDHRSDDAGLAFTEALRSGCAMVSLQCPSRLDFDKQRADANGKTIYGIVGAPWDSSLRARLALASPEALRPSFKAVVGQLQRGKALDEMVLFPGGYV